MIHAFTQSTFSVYISTEDNRIETRVASTQIRHLFKFINDMDGSIQYAYGYREDIFNRYTELGFLYDFVPDVYAGKTKLLPSGHYKYEVYEVSWIGTVAVALNTAPATETDVLPVADANGVVQGLVTKGILYVTEKEGTEQVQYTQHAEPDETNYIWYDGYQFPTEGFKINTANTIVGGTTSTQYQLPLIDKGALNMIVNWGDGSIDTITSYNQAETLHTYSTSGIYIISIENEVKGWQQSPLFTKEALKLIEISKWGDFNISNAGGFFDNVNLVVTATDKPIITDVFVNASFYNCELFNAPVDDWDMSMAWYLASFFGSCDVFNQPVNSWDTSSFREVSSMFGACLVFNQPLDNWDMSNVTDMSGMFNNAIIFDKPLNMWDTSSNTDTHGMFSSATAFNQPLNLWDMSNVTNINAMFASATAFDQDISSWDIRNVTDADNFMWGATLSTANYDLLLVAWEANTPPSSLVIGFGNSKYSLASAAATARANLISTYSWVITDGGGI